MSALPLPYPLPRGEGDTTVLVATVLYEAYSSRFNYRHFGWRAIGPHDGAGRRATGYRCHIFCPDKDEPAVAVSAAHTQGAFDDRTALEKFAKAVDVVTLEWENVPLAALEILKPLVAVHPSSDVLRVAQDRANEKTFARELGIGTADFTVVNSEAELEKALEKFSLPAILKSTRMGYDGKGQVKITPGMKAAAVWKEMGGTVGILESFVDFLCEISVIVARRADGATAASIPQLKIFIAITFLRKRTRPHRSIPRLPRKPSISPGAWRKS